MFIFISTCFYSNNYQQSLLLLLFLTPIGFALKVIFCNKLTLKQGAIISITPYLLIIYLSILSYYQTNSGPFYLQENKCFNSNTLSTSQHFICGNYLQCFSDELSFIFSTTTLLIGIFANLYTFIYLESDVNLRSFLNFLNLFIISMCFLTLFTNILLVLFCWEFLGISSFFLINHYFKRAYSFKSAYKAFCYNRFSDLTFFLFAVLFIFNTNTLSLQNIPNLQSSYTSTLMYTLLLLTAFIKSAQGIFFGWLPDSMEAPIPASALIHSATLVAAGIYLLLRLDIFILTNPYVIYALLAFGGFSAVLFSGISFLQTDIKKLLAYSTIANCGFMYLLIGMCCLKQALLFFIVHGLLKSLIFLIAGNFIIVFSHNQDFQKWGLNNNLLSLWKIINIAFFMLGGLNLTFSYEIKHLFVSGSIVLSNLQSLLLQYILIIYALNSIMYSTKLFLTYAQLNTVVLLKKKIINVNFKVIEFFFVLVIFTITYILLKFILDLRTFSIDFIYFYSFFKIILLSLTFSWFINKDLLIYTYLYSIYMWFL